MSGDFLLTVDSTAGCRKSKGNPCFKLQGFGWWLLIGLLHISGWDGRGAQCRNDTGGRGGRGPRCKWSVEWHGRSRIHANSIYLLAVLSFAIFTARKMSCKEL